MPRVLLCAGRMNQWQAGPAAPGAGAVSPSRDVKPPARVIYRQQECVCLPIPQGFVTPFPGMGGVFSTGRKMPAEREGKGIDY